MTELPTLDEAVELFKALGDPVRLRLLGLIAERPRSGTELAEAVAVGAPTISHHMEKLTRAGLVVAERDGQRRLYSIDTSRLNTWARSLAPAPAPALVAASEEQSAEELERAKVIRDFFEGERLKQIPAQRKKRVIVLQHLLAKFEPGRDYSEREVSQLLKQVHEDFATLRRELVDYGFMQRAGGVYRVAQSLPARSTQVRQEFSGDEQDWFRRFLASSIRS